MSLSRLIVVSLFGCVLALAAGPPVRVNMVQAEKQAINKPKPMYPMNARQMHISGEVEVDATVDESGNVEKTEVVKGHAMLSGAAQMAAKNWTFKPFTEEGKPVKALVRLIFNFTL